MMRNLLAQLEGAGTLVAQGQTTAANGSTYVVVGPLAFQADIVIAKSGTGVYTITCNPFRGPQGLVYADVGLTTASGLARVDSAVYTGDSLVITVKTFAVDGTTATDTPFSFQIIAV